MVKGFKEFVMRGNVVDLAVAFVLGLAFAPIVTSIVEGIITPIIGRIFGQPDLDSVMNIDIGKGAVIAIGPILTAIISFLSIAAAVYFLIIVPMRKFGPQAPEAPAGPTEIELLTEIRDSLKK